MKIAADLWGEAHTLAQLQHPNIVPVYSVHHREPFQAVCMPYQGWTTFQDLLDKLKKAPLPTSGLALAGMFKQPPSETIPPTAGTGLTGMAAPAQGAETAATFAAKLATLSYVEAIGWLAAQLAAGLAHAHEHGIVHHDLKPANLLLSDDGRPMLLDFNVAEDTKRPPGTAVAWVAGTLPYMAPEQWAAMQGAQVAVDTRSDVYAFGVILFKLLTGRYPFKHFPSTPGNGEAVLEERRAAPPRLRNWNPAVSPALEAIVRRCLEPEPRGATKRRGTCKKTWIASTLTARFDTCRSHPVWSERTSGCTATPGAWSSC